MDKYSKLAELQNCETFEQELAMANSPEELQKLLANHGIEMTMDEIREMVVYATSQTEGELSETDLDDVSGGVWKAIGKFVLDQVAKWFFKKGLDKLTGW